MAGGVGSRLYPLSTPEKPKQFLDILGVGRTLLQMTVDRFLSIDSLSEENLWVVTSENYVGYVREQVPGIPEENILAEPCARNTAPCIAYACWKIALRHPGARIVVTPADALVLEKQLFAEVIGKALDFCAPEDERIVTVGIKPTRPATGYGYIFAPEAIAGPAALGKATGVVKVGAFKEKPSQEVAQAYLADGRYFWNAGIFVWSAVTIKKQLRRYAPQIAAVMDELEPSFYTSGEPAELSRLFPTCDKISIDYAVMEKSPYIHVIAADLGWSDLGSFEAIDEARNNMK